VRIVVADSNRFATQGSPAELMVIGARTALAHESAVIGAIPAGTFPSESPSTHRTSGCSSPTSARINSKS
jgi:hypothetical protein